MSRPDMPFIYTLFGFRLGADIINILTFRIIIEIDLIYY